jgi:hypothetical protein
MDAALFILLQKKSNIPISQRDQKTIFWEGQEFPQGPPILRWGKYCSFQESRLAEWINNLIPVCIKHADMATYLVGGNCLDMLEKEVNGHGCDWDYHRFDDFLHEALSRSGVWAMIFLWQWDQIDFVEESTVDGAVSRLKQNLNWSTQRQGFICYQCSGRDESA